LELQRHGSERCQHEGAACRKQQIRASVSTEWLSIGTANRSNIDAEALQIGVATTLRRDWSESRWRRKGAVGQSHSDDGFNMCAEVN
jgi:hypothetical protein